MSTHRDYLAWRKGKSMLRSLALLDEPFQQILLSTEVDFVWCTTAEDGARNLPF